LPKRSRTNRQNRENEEIAVVAPSYGEKYKADALGVSVLAHALTSFIDAQRSGNPLIASEVLYTLSFFLPSQEEGEALREAMDSAQLGPEEQQYLKRLERDWRQGYITIDVLEQQRQLLEAEARLRAGLALLPQLKSLREVMWRASPVVM